jgi:hypothetical protein
VNEVKDFRAGVVRVSDYAATCDNGIAPMRGAAENFGES